jgi:acetoin utilization deacetylase AcuC-like enzyme
VIPVVWSDEMLRHDPRDEIWVGVRTDGTEVPRRATVVREALAAAGHPELPVTPHPDEVLLEVHEAGLVDWLRTAWSAWEAGPYAAAVGSDRVVPYVFPTPFMTSGMPWRYPAATHARAGIWCYDTMTVVGPGTWEAARTAVDAGLTAVDLVLDPASGSRSAYALTRPPGHHAAPAGFGGSCYLNTGAVAAQALARTGLRVAVLDIDAHHGNGTQAVFWERPDVLYASVHVDPAAGWFPHVLGHGQERGSGPGTGATVNVPLPPGTDDEGWLSGVRLLVEAALRFDAEAVVLSLGLDAAEVDPESPLRVSRDGYARAGALVAALDLPTVVVAEGGYDLDAVGDLAVASLATF